MKVQQVAFDGERVRPKRWTISDVGHRLKTLAADAQPRDVNAIGGNELVVAGEVEGRHSVLLPIASSAARSGEDTERPSQQRARLTYFAGGKQFADLAAGDVMPTPQLLGIDDCLEAHLLAERTQRVHVPLRLVAEMEVVTFVHLAGMEPFNQHLLAEIVCRHQREVTRERQQQHGIYAGSLQQLQLDRQRRQELGRDVWPQNAERMGFEGHHHRLAAKQVRALRHAPHHLLMGAVHAVKVAHAHHRGTQIRWYVFEFVEDLHWARVLEVELEFEAIVGQAHVFRQRGVGLLMRQIVRDVREVACFGFRRSTNLRELSTVECVGCGWCRKASRNRMSRSCNWVSDSSGTLLKSVRYAAEPKR